MGDDGATLGDVVVFSATGVNIEKSRRVDGKYQFTSEVMPSGNLLSYWRSCIRVEPGVTLGHIFDCIRALPLVEQKALSKLVNSDVGVVNTLFAPKICNIKYVAMQRYIERSSSTGQNYGSVENSLSVTGVDGANGNYSLDSFSVSSLQNLPLLVSDVAVFQNNVDGVVTDEEFCVTFITLGEALTALFDALFFPAGVSVTAALEKPLFGGAVRVAVA